MLGVDAAEEGAAAGVAVLETDGGAEGFVFLERLCEGGDLFLDTLLVDCQAVDGLLLVSDGRGVLGGSGTTYPGEPDQRACFQHGLADLAHGGGLFLVVAGGLGEGFGD